MKLRVAVALLGLVGGCRDATSPAGIAVAVKIPAEFRAGEPQQVEVRVTNISDRTHDVSGKACPLPIDVYDAAGRVVGPEALFCTAELQNRALLPGESFTYVFTWSGRSNDHDEDGRARPLGPGFYTVKGKALVTGLGMATGPGTAIRIIE